MQHIEKSAFPRGGSTYTALAGTAETLTRYRIYRHGGMWVAEDPINGRPTVRKATLRELDEHFVLISKEG